MAQIIHKVVLAVKAVQNIEIPVGAQIIKADRQFNGIFDGISLWYIFKEDNIILESRKIGCFMTGERIDYSIKEYIDTVLFSDGSLVFHVFELEYD
jgi:hypothetical protein